MTLRSPSRGEYWKRMAIVVLLGAAAYATVISEKGGGATFKIWRPERMRFAVIMLVVVGAAAYELRPVAGRGQGDVLKGEQDVLPLAEESASPGSGEDAPAGGTSGLPIVAGQVPRSDGRTAAPVAGHQTEASSIFARKDGDLADAETAWEMARDLQHNFIPDELEDCEYLRLVRRAAELGHRMAMIKLGDYAFRRGWIVEAYYWTLLAQMLGAPGLGDALEEIRKTWMKEGTPPEYENVRPDFTETQGVFARAVLRLKCKLDVSLAHKRLQELREAKCPEALLYLRKAEELHG